MSAEQNATSTPPSTSYPEYPPSVGSPQGSGFDELSSNMNALREYHRSTQQAQNGRPMSGEMDRNIDPALGDGGEPSSPNANIGVHHPSFHSALDPAMNSAAHDSASVSAQLSAALGQGPAAQALAQGVMNMEREANGSSTMNQRKRSKVSRACDECRRKKIRCDFTLNSDEGGQPDVQSCTNCRRAHVSCEFSRQPMKRGPSRGYIKDLADRVLNLEQSRPAGDSPLSGRQADLFQGFEQPYSPNQLQAGRKRSHSISERDDSLYVSGHRQSVGYQDDPNRIVTPPHTHLISALTNAFASEAGAQHSVPPHTSEQALLEEYYRLVHSSLPILSHDPADTVTRLNLCPQALRDAFSRSLDHLIRTSASCSLPADSSTALKRAQLAGTYLNAWEYDDQTASAQLPSKLVYIQALLFMAVAADSFGPSGMQGKLGPTNSMWMSRAIDVVQELGLSTVDNRETFFRLPEDSNEALGRRLFWVSFILDRFHAFANHSPLKVTEASLVPRYWLYLDDTSILRVPTFHLANTCDSFGGLVSTLSSRPDPGPKTGSGSHHPAPDGDFIQDILRKLHAMLPAKVDPLSRLAYLHAQTLLLRLHPTVRAADLLPAAAEVADILDTEPEQLGPLTHHFAALAAVTLAECCAADHQRAGDAPDAPLALARLEHALRSGPASASEPGLGWDSAIGDFLATTRVALGLGDAGAANQPMGLVHLAAAAETAKESSSAAVGAEGAGTGAGKGKGKGATNGTGAGGVDAETMQRAAAAAQSQMEPDWVGVLRTGYLKAVLGAGNAR